MPQPFDDTDRCCADGINVTSIDLKEHLSIYLNLLSDTATTESDVLPPLKSGGISADDRPAAVLVPLLKVQNEWHILMTKRAANLVHHAGQISFPGGKVEAEDSGPAATALREAFEEIHLAPDWVQILGGLDAVRSPAGFVVQPVVGIVSGENRLQSLVLDPSEVELIFTLPIAHAANPRNLRLVSRKTDGRQNDYWVIDHHEHFIWGLSARVLVDLCQRFGVLAEAKI